MLGPFVSDNGAEVARMEEDEKEEEEEVRAGFETARGREPDDGEASWA